MLNECVVLSENLGGVDLIWLQRAQSLEGAPQSRIKLQSLSVILNRLFLLRLHLSDVSQEVEASSTVWNFFQVLGIHEAQLSDVVLIQEHLFSFRKSVKFDASECKFVAIRGRLTPFEYLVGFVGLALAKIAFG